MPGPCGRGLVYLLHRGLGLTHMGSRLPCWSSQSLWVTRVHIVREAWGGYRGFARRACSQRQEPSGDEQSACGPRSPGMSAGREEAYGPQPPGQELRGREVYSQKERVGAMSPGTQEESCLSRQGAEVLSTRWVAGSGKARARNPSVVGILV